jgi:hypothetical protein
MPGIKSESQKNTIYLLSGPNLNKYGKIELRDYKITLYYSLFCPLRTEILLGSRDMIQRKPTTTLQGGILGQT